MGKTLGDTVHLTELRRLVPDPVILPDERRLDYQALHEALLTDLAPGTAYETVLAENIVGLEWERLRHRRIRDEILRSCYCAVAVRAFKGQDIHVRVSGGLTRGREHQLAREVAYGDTHGRSRAEAQLIQAGHNVSELLAVAYVEAHPLLDFHERKLADLEIRRRRLRDDFDQVTARRLRVLKAEEL